MEERSLRAMFACIPDADLRVMAYEAGREIIRRERGEDAAEQWGMTAERLMVMGQASTSNAHRYVVPLDGTPSGDRREGGKEV